MNLADKIEEISLIHGNPTEILSSCLRGFIIPSEGSDFIGCDFSSIEARVTAWIANDLEYLQDFRDGIDPYIKEAALAFRIPMSRITKDQRQIGKVKVLAFGFGGGKGAYQVMAKGYGVKASDKEAEAHKVQWRKNHPKIVNYWYSLQAAAIQAVQNPGKAVICGRVTYIKTGSFLRCRLPSGRFISYPFPEVVTMDTPIGRRPGLRAKEMNNNKWERRNVWYGVLMENIVQAIARDFLVHSMFLLDEHNYEIVMHVHDEIVIEIEKGISSVATIENLCQETPEWADDFPLEAEGWRGIRYQK